MPDANTAYQRRSTVTLLMRSDRFLKSVLDLSPRWGGTTWSLERYLQTFDESGDLRPLYRAHLPESYAHWHAQRAGMQPRQKLSPREDDELAHLHDLLSSIILVEDDPEAPHILRNPPDELVGIIRVPIHGEIVRWSDWKVVVGEINGHPKTEPHVVSYYGEWQRLRMWALLEKYSMRLLLDPRELHPRQLFDPSWDRDIRGKMLTWTSGNPRMLRIVELLEADEWLNKLYSSRNIYRLAQSRVWDPRLHGWPEGEELSDDARLETQMRYVREHCCALGERWLQDKPDFIGRIKLMIEFWDAASQQRDTHVTQVIESDITSATRWAHYLYGLDLETLTREVGGCGTRKRTTLAHVLRPGWRGARTTAEQHLSYFAESFNHDISVILLESDDIASFLEFLDKQELWSWFVELSRVIEETDSPTDLTWDRRFLHLRSLAIMFEPVLLSIADQWGTDQDRIRLQRGEVKKTLSAFFGDRDGWRTRSWQCVSANWNLTQTTGAGLEQRLEEISMVECGGGLEGVARTLLTFAALRNFGSHRFSRDSAFLSDFQPQLLAAAVYTPLLYWKVATRLG